MVENDNNKLRAERKSLVPSTSKSTELSKKKKEKKTVDKKTTKKQKVSIEKLRKVYKILIDDELPDIADEIAERKKLLVSIKKTLK
jgi:hypothetical protein